MKNKIIRISIISIGILIASVSIMEKDSFRHRQVSTNLRLNEQSSTTNVVDHSDQVEAKKVDLNNDGIDEIMERGDGKVLCGASSCPTIIYQIVNGKREALLDVATEAFPQVLTTETHGYKDLQFGPDASGQVMVLKWNGTDYGVPK